MVTNSKPLRDFYKRASISLTKTKLIYTFSLSWGEGTLYPIFFGNGVPSPLQSSNPPSPQERE